MIPLDADQAGRALGVGALAGPVTRVSVDSRTLQPGDLFVALRGERFDGHAYVKAALAAGAVGAVVEKKAWERLRKAGSAAPGPIYEVDDTLQALGSLAREVRRSSGALVFAVTGSVGKTSTKDLLRAMSSRVLRVTATAGNQNNEVGVPLTLLALEPDTQAVVTEMGMRGHGQIAALAAVAEPDVGVITNVHPVHLELLGTIEGIAGAKAELPAGVRPGGAAVVPGECAPLEPHLDGCDCRVVRFGVGAEARGADVRGWLEEGERQGEYILALRWPEGEARVATAYLPKHTVENAVAAAAACYAAGLPVAACAAGIADVRFSEGRGQVLELGSLCLIDDTYNANPAAVRAAVDDLVRLAARRGGRPVAVLGDMLELGPDSERFHRDAGAYAAEAGVQALWGVGERAEAMVWGFSAWHAAKGRPGAQVGAAHVSSSGESGEIIAGLRRGDVVLLKASRSVRLENVVRSVVGEAKAGRWGSASMPQDGAPDDSGENR